MKNRVIGYLLTFSPALLLGGTAYWFGGWEGLFGVIVGALIGLGLSRVSIIGIEMLDKNRQ